MGVRRRALTIPAESSSALNYLIYTHKSCITTKLGSIIFMLTVYVLFLKLIKLTRTLQM